MRYVIAVILASSITMSQATNYSGCAGTNEAVTARLRQVRVSGGIVVRHTLV